MKSKALFTLESESLWWPLGLPRHTIHLWKCPEFVLSRHTSFIYFLFNRPFIQFSLWCYPTNSLAFLYRSMAGGFNSNGQKGNVRLLLDGFSCPSVKAPRKENMKEKRSLGKEQNPVLWWSWMQNDIHLSVAFPDWGFEACIIQAWVIRTLGNRGGLHKRGEDSGLCLSVLYVWQQQAGFHTLHSLELPLGIGTQETCKERELRTRHKPYSCRMFPPIDKWEKISIEVKKKANICI